MKDQFTLELKGQSNWADIQADLSPGSILYKSIVGRDRPVSYPDGPITARYRFIKNASWVNPGAYVIKVHFHILQPI